MTQTVCGTVIHRRMVKRGAIYTIFVPNSGHISFISTTHTLTLLDRVTVSLSDRSTTPFLRDCTINVPSPLSNTPQNLLPVSYLCALSRHFTDFRESETVFIENITQSAHAPMTKHTIQTFERAWLAITGFGIGDEQEPTQRILEYLPQLRRLRSAL